MAASTRKASEHALLHCAARERSPVYVAGAAHGRYAKEIACGDEALLEVRIRYLPLGSRIDTLGTLVVISYMT